MICRYNTLFAVWESFPQGLRLPGGMHEKKQGGLEMNQKHPFKKAVALFLVMTVLLGLMVVGAFAAAPATSNHFNVVAVVDASGSMLSNDPSGLRYEAIDLFANLLAEKGNVLGAVAFNEEVIAHDPAVAVDSRDAKMRVVNALRQVEVRPNADTNIGAALDEAINMLQTDGDESLPSVILLLSDGNTDLNTQKKMDASLEAKAEAIQRAREQGIRVFSVCLNVNGKADLAEMEQISSATGGVFQEVKTPDDLQGVFNSFYSLIYGAITQEIVNEKFPPGGRVETDFEIPGIGVEEVNVIMYGDVKTIELIQPDGQKLEPEMIRSESFVMIKLTDVMPGRWKLITTGIPGGQIRINMVYNSNMGIQVETEPDSLEIRPDETLRVKAWLTNPDGKADARQNTGYKVELVLMDPMDQEIERIDMKPVDDHFEAEKQFSEGSYQYQVVASGYGLERASEVFGPLIVDATHNNTAPVPVENPVVDRVYFWPFTDGATYTLDMNTLATDAQESQLNYQIVSASFLEGKDYTVDPQGVIHMENFSLRKGAYTIRAVDSGGLSCDVEVVVQSYNIGILALLGLAALGLLGLIIFGIVLRILLTRPFAGTITASTNVNFQNRQKTLDNPGRGRKKLSAFNLDNMGLDPSKTYFQATGKNYIELIPNVPVFTQKSGNAPVKKVVIENNLPVTVKVKQDSPNELTIRFTSRLKNGGRKGGAPGKKSGAPGSYSGPGGGSYGAPGGSSYGAPGGKAGQRSKWKK